MNVIYAKGSEGIQFNKICEEGTKEAASRGWIKHITSLNGKLVRLEHITSPIDIYHCHSAHSLEGIRKAKQLGAITILQRDSSHILDMLEWVEEGMRIWKGKYPQCMSNPRARTNLDFQLAEYEEADWILVASKLEEKSFINRGINKNKIKRIPFTVDFNKFKPINNKHQFSVVLGGGNNIRKGYPEANEACKLAGINLNLVPSQPRGNEFVLSELNKHDVCIAPTREDGYPCMVLESMSCGLVPIVSTRNGVSELIEDGVNGYIVDLFDKECAIEKMAEILTFLKENPKKRKEISLKARETVSKRTWEDYSKDVANFYQKIMSKEVKK